MKYPQFILILIIPLFLGFAYQAEAFTLSKSAIGNTLGLVGWWTFDGPTMTNNVADSSGRGNNAILVGFTGATSTNVKPGKIGRALHFRGAQQNNYASSTNASFNFERTDPFSVSAWVKIDGSFAAGCAGAFVGKMSAAAIGWSVNVLGSGCGVNYNNRAVYVAIQGGTNQNLTRQTATNTITDNVWAHVVMTYDGSSNATGITTYVDGVNKTMTTVSPGNASISTSILNTSSLRIGDDSFSDYFSGLMDDVRVYNRTLSASEVLALYNQGTQKIGVPQKTSLNNGLVGYWTFDGKDMPQGLVSDVTGNANNGSKVNMATSSANAPGVIGQALSFDNSDDYINLPSTIASVLSGASAATFSAWTKRTSIGTRDVMVDLTNSFSNSKIFCEYQADNTIRCGARASSGDTFQSEVSSLTYISSNWVHVVAVFDIANDDIRIYADGVNLSTTGVASWTATTFDNTTGSFQTLGSSQGSNPFAGSIDDVRIYNRALSVSEIKELYNMGAGNKTAVSVPVTGSGNAGVSGLVGWWTFDGKDMPQGLARDISGVGNHGSLVNMSTSTSRRPGKIGQALSFDGVDDYVTVGNDISRGSSGSVSVWVNTSNKNQGDQRFLSLKEGTASNNAVFFGFYDGDASQLYDGRFHILIRPGVANTLLAYGNTTITSNTWYHVAYTMNPTDGLKMYVNGVEQTLTYLTGLSSIKDWWDDIPSPTQWDIGRSLFPNITVNPFVGQIDDVRIYNRALSAAEVLQLYNQTR